MERENTTLSALSAIAFSAWAKGKGYDPVFRVIGDPGHSGTIHGVNNREGNGAEIMPCYDVSASGREYTVEFDQDFLILHDKEGVEIHRFPATMIVTHMAYKAGTDECVLSSSSESFCLIDKELMSHEGGDIRAQCRTTDGGVFGSEKRRWRLKVIK